MDSAVKRPWYRLHWVTWVVIGLLAGALMLSESEESKTFTAGMPDGYASWTYFGWPQAHLEVVESGSYVGAGTRVPRSFDYRWHWSILGFNVLVCGAIMGSTTWVAESWLRSSNRLQFKLQSMLLFTGVVGVLLWLSVNSDWLFWSEDELILWAHSPLASWHGLEKPLRWPVVFGLACTIYSLGWLSLALLRRAYRIVRP